VIVTQLTKKNNLATAECYASLSWITIGNKYCFPDPNI